MMTEAEARMFDDTQYMLNLHLVRHMVRAKRAGTSNDEEAWDKMVPSPTMPTNEHVLDMVRIVLMQEDSSTTCTMEGDTMGPVWMGTDMQRRVTYKASIMLAAEFLDL